MERDLRIKVSKKTSVYGRFSGSLSRPLFIVAHGLPGHFEELLPQGSARWFARRGFATFRFDLYGWQKDARQLIDCTLRTHADDLDSIVSYFRKKGVKKIFVAGHSYGCPTILLSRNQDFNAVVLWDPSYKSSFIHKRYGMPGGKYVNQLKGYFMRWGVNPVIGEKMAKEADTLPWDDLTKNFHVPIKLVVAQKGVLMAGAKRYFKTANNPKDLVVIRGATHYFDDKIGMHEEVFKISEKWFKRF